MEHYLFTARSITHAQQMAQVLGRAGIPVKMRRVGRELTKSGCGYMLEIPYRRHALALDALRGANVRPVRIFSESGGAMREVTS